MFRFVLALIIVSICTACNPFYKKADKENSELRGILPLPDSDEGAYAMEARYSSWPNPDTLTISINNETHLVLADGTVLSQAGEELFHIGNEGNIERLFFVQRANDIFFFYGMESDSLGIVTCASRVSLESRQNVWTTQMDGISFSRPLVRGQFAYVCTLGTIGKIKLKSGAFDWKFTNLASDTKYRDFRDIDFPDERHVRFVSSRPFSMQRDTVVVNDITGEIIRMN